MLAAGQRIRGQTTIDRLSLSARFHSSDRRVIERMRTQLVSSVRAGESVTRTAERLLDVDIPKVELPAHVRALRDAARFQHELGDPNLYDDAVQQWRARVEALGEQLPGGERVAARPARRSTSRDSIRSATQQLIKDLRRARPEQVSKIVDRWVLERARHQARLVARHETVEAFRDTYRQSTAGREYVKGYRWTLSNRHPRADVCDVLANQNLHGLGPGGYPVDAVPSTPHPLDLCSLVAIIDTDHFRRQLVREQGDQEPPRPWEDGDVETGEEWLRRQPASVQQQLLGPTRARVLAAGGQVLDSGGKPLPVHVVLGEPKPLRRTGPRVAAAPLVQADRARMTRPFPSI